MENIIDPENELSVIESTKTKINEEIVNKIKNKKFKEEDDTKDFVTIKEDAEYWRNKYAEAVAKKRDKDVSWSERLAEVERIALESDI